MRLIITAPSAAMTKPQTRWLHLRRAFPGRARRLVSLGRMPHGALNKRLGEAMRFDVRAFRQALGAFPTGVAVVTTAEPGHHPLGITVNSFTSVSLDPPLVLWCLDRKSDRFERFTKASCFTVSVLGTAHEEISARLA